MRSDPAQKMFLQEEFVAGRQLHFEHIPGAENPVDVLTEPFSQHTLKTFVEPLLVWKRDAVDTPPGDPVPSCLHNSV